MTYENFVQVLLAEELAIDATSALVASPGGAYQLPPEEGGILILADSAGTPAYTEIISYTSRTGNTLNGLVRAQEGTEARVWPMGTFCYQSLTAGEFARTIKTDSATGAALLPAGTEAERPTTPINGLLRYNNETNQFEGYQNGKWGSIGGGDALFAVEWWPKRSSVPAGYVPADGQLLSRATFPDAAAGIDAGMMPVVTEAEWDADLLLRGSYTAGDGSTTFRLPDYNGQSAGAFGPLFLRGGASEGGVIQRDAFKSHEHGLGTHGVVTNAHGPSGSGYYMNGTYGQELYSTGLEGAEETRPLNVGGVWVVKLFGAVVNEGQADAAQLATDVASLSGRVSTVEGEKPLGWGQTWKTVLASRALGVEYINTTGRPIVINVGAGPTQSSNLRVKATIGNSGEVFGSYAQLGGSSTLSVVVPAGGTYTISHNSTGTPLFAWGELS